MIIRTTTTKQYYLVTATHKTGEIITIGQFNDFHDAVTLATILTDERNNSYVEVCVEEVTKTPTSRKTVRVYYYTVEINA